MRLFTVIGGIVLVSLATPGTASAYAHYTCAGIKQSWSSNTATFLASPTSFPNGSPERDALITTMNRWNLNPSYGKFKLLVDSGGVAFGNLDNEIWYTDSRDFHNGAPGRALYYYGCITGGLWEVDIVINNNPATPWTTTTSKRSLCGYRGGSTDCDAGDWRPVRATLGHELGHGLGLRHTNNTYNVMGQSWSHLHANGYHARFYAGEDAFHGLTYLYGVRQGIEDLGVVHWRRTGKSGEYSRHQRTRVFQAGSNVVLRADWIYGEPYYRVRPGQRVAVEFTFENNGRSRHENIDTHFYVSTNDLISTWDQWLTARNDLDLGRNTVFTTRTELTIPTNLSTTRNCRDGKKGCHFLGVIIDDDDSVQEVIEWNNASYVGIRVIPTP